MKYLIAACAFVLVASPVAAQAPVLQSSILAQAQLVGELFDDVKESKPYRRWMAAKDVLAQMQQAAALLATADKAEPEAK